MKSQNAKDFANKIIKSTNMPLSFALFVLTKDEENTLIFENDVIKSKKLRVDDTNFIVFETTIKNFEITRIEYTVFDDSIDCCSTFDFKNLESCYKDLSEYHIDEILNGMTKIHENSYNTRI